MKNKLATPMSPNELARSNYLFWTMLPIVLFDFIDDILDWAEGAWRTQQVDEENGWETDRPSTQTPMMISNNDLVYICLSNETGHSLNDMRIRATKGIFGDVIITAIADIGFYRDFDGFLNKVCIVEIPTLNTNLVLEILEYEADLPDGPCIGTLFPMKTVPSGTTLGRRVRLSLESAIA